MASKMKLERLAQIASAETAKAGLRLNNQDQVEVTAIIIHSMHLSGNTEGQARVGTVGWREVSASWKSRYRGLAKKAMGGFGG